MAGCPTATVSASAHAAPPSGLQRNQKSLVAQIVGDFAIQQDGASAMKRLELLPGRWMSWWRERKHCVNVDRNCRDLNITLLWTHDRGLLLGWRENVAAARLTLTGSANYQILSSGLLDAHRKQ